MIEIKLTQNKIAIIDDVDLALVSEYKWRAHKGRNGFYAITNIGPWRESKVIQMQNLIINEVPPRMMVDHKDRDGLNNQRANLRICTRSQNGANRTPWGKSKYLGVSKVKGRNKWRAFIGVNGINLYLGIFDTEILAAAEYNAAAAFHKGEFANLNNISEP